MTERVACTDCGVLILPATAQETGGLCMPCGLAAPPSLRMGPAAADLPRVPAARRASHGAEAFRYLAIGLREGTEERMPKIRYDDRGIV